MNEAIADTILYSCSAKQYRGSEQFVSEHSLGYIIAGEMHLFLNGRTIVCKEGTIGLTRKNQLLKSVKMPPPKGEFKSISIYLTQEMLRQYSNEHGIIAAGIHDKTPAVQLPADNPFLKGYFQSLLPYCVANEKLSPSLGKLKAKEAVEILLKIQPGLRDMLFDFSEPHKIDLEAFMNRNFTYNVPLTNFAKLSGRSLAGFKRDFEKIFNTSPGTWLQQKRLKEAYFLIKEKRKKPSDVYLDVGFENLSHFSYAFKKAYGQAPSMV